MMRNIKIDVKNNSKSIKDDEKCQNRHKISDTYRLKIMRHANLK